MGHSHDTPARRNFLKMSARLAALGLTSLGVQPARQFFVRDVQAQRPRDRLQGARLRVPVRWQRRQQPDRARRQLHGLFDRARRHRGRGAGRQYAAADSGAGRRHLWAAPVAGRTGADLQRGLPRVRAEHGRAQPTLDETGVSERRFAGRRTCSRTPTRPRRRRPARRRSTPGGAAACSISSGPPIRCLRSRCRRRPSSSTAPTSAATSSRRARTWACRA